MEGAGRRCQNGRGRDLVTCARTLKLSAPTCLFGGLPSLVKQAQQGQIPDGGWGVGRVKAWEVERFPQGLTQSRELGLLP